MFDFSFPVKHTFRQLRQTLRTAVDTKVDLFEILVIFDLITLQRYTGSNC
jgi:hypothetical protein